MPIGEGGSFGVNLNKNAIDGRIGESFTFILVILIIIIHF